MIKDLFQKTKTRLIQHQVFPNQIHFKATRVLDPTSSISSFIPLSHSITILYLYIYLYLILLTHIFIINFKCLIQRQVPFQNNFSINWKVKVGCTYLCTTLKYLGCRSYLACSLMFDFLFKTFNNKTSSIWCSEREKEWLGCHCPLNSRVF